ncbi:LysM peptidoglycan-binding domain-containing protein [Deinococcus sp. SL84]|uniref:LysM peptidoglycan-binding domain-containing protein n=1 Tax=Deinococcus sp. SL84 TaxID=2994663 RepID=UPI002274794A|nr:LysM peptidoglycan-binding domain-containing protein [Deinococcus sp. SL84]MCY1702509.1 LysM peptidoglycan-binding domain-containing protein [Deinococcus sp. SL84]
MRPKLLSALQISPPRTVLYRTVLDRVDRFQIDQHRIDRRPVPPHRRVFARVLAALTLLGAAQAQTVTVQPGDTLWSIAQRSGVSVAGLRAANGLSGDTIRAGQQLRLRAPDRAGSAQGVPTHPYTVRRGDTLAGISRRTGISVADLRRANGLGGDFLAAGQRLRVPVRPLPQALPAGQTVKVVYGYVTVQPGQNLRSLAAQYRTTPGDLLAANYLRSGQVYAGQRLRVPKRIPVPQPPRPVAPPVSLHARAPLGIPVRMVRVDLRWPGVLVSPVMPQSGRGARVSTLARQSGADAVINGSYFHPQTYAPAGDLVRSGQLLSWGRIPAALAITPDNRAVITGGTGSPGPKAWRGMETVIATGPRILVGGQIRRTYGTAFRDPAVFGRAARSAVGLSGNRDLFLVSTQARLTPSEMAKVMRQLGAQNALLLDGGSSAGLAWGNRAVMDSVRSVAFGIGVYGNYSGRRYMR